MREGERKWSKRILLKKTKQKMARSGLLADFYKTFWSYLFTDLCHKLNKEHMFGKVNLLTEEKDREIYPMQGKFI